MNDPKHTHSAKIQDAEIRAGQWLAKGNEYSERGKKDKAEECYRKSSFWLDRANNLRGWGE